jgi:hypothetical protein
MEKIQDKAEASKKKHNEFTGKTSSYFSILNSVDPNVLESIAVVSNINLGENEARITANISSIRAIKRARTALIDAKKKVADQAQGTVMGDDRGNTDENEEGEAAGADTEKQKVEEQGSERPPKKTSETDYC